MTNHRTGRILVIGLDGYDEALAERLMREGKLPNFQRLHARAARFDLDHGSEKYSGLSWEHVSTGRSPRLTGRWSAVDFNPRTYSVTQAPTRMPPFAAELVSKMVVFDVPYFDLAQAPNVKGIVSWGAHDPGIRAQSNPPGLHQELLRRFGDYQAQAFIYGFTWPSADRTAKAGVALLRAVEQRRDAARWLFAERLPEWDVGMLVISEFHSVIEPMWHGVDPCHPLHALPSAIPARKAIEDVYGAADALLGDLIEAFPEATVVAFAMHGMGPNAADVPSMLLLPELLYCAQFGRRLFEPPQAWLDAKVPMLSEDARWEAAINRCLAHPSRSVQRVAREWLKRVTDRVRARVARASGQRWLWDDEAAEGSLTWMPATNYAPYWPRMEAFALPSFYDGRVRLNVQGRERDGCVPPSAYGRTLERISALLRECTDPATGAPIVEEISGPEGDDFMHLGVSDADLKIVWHGAPLGLQHPRIGQIGPVPYRRTGGHTGDSGVALFAGAGITPGAYGRRSSLDVVPTILDLLGESGSATLSGRSLRDTGFLTSRSEAPVTVR